MKAVRRLEQSTFRRMWTSAAISCRGRSADDAAPY
jgi:hypothetical protein